MPRVIIVDDDHLVRDNLVAYLEDEGMQPTGVPTGEEALEQVRTGRCFDVCVMDMRLPGMDGNDSIRALHREDPALAFVIHTGSALYDLPEDLQHYGISAQHLFYKPLQDMAPLADAIRQLATRSSP